MSNATTAARRGSPGSAGTGKTIVALHRAVFLARRHAGAQVLLTTFSSTLANALRTKLGRLAGNEPDVHGRISVHSIIGIGHTLYADVFGEPVIASDALTRLLLEEAAKKVGDLRFSVSFLLGEWTDIVDAWQLKSWEGYRNVARLGRKTRIGGKQREVLWSIFADVRAELDKRGKITESDMFARVTAHFEGGSKAPFDYAVVDEAQDIGVAPLRFLVALGASRPDSLFFAGDLGQRIFQAPFSWKALGVDIRGRSHTLRINYRTSHQIRSRADRLLPLSLADVDGTVESRKGTVSVFNGPPPTIETFDNEDEEGAAVGNWISGRLKEGFLPHEIGIFVRSENELRRAAAALRQARADFVQLDDTMETSAGHVFISTMHLAKGLEFRAVAVMACDDGVLPLQERIEKVSDESDLEEVCNTERHLLYVACTRARDQLLVTGVDPASEFLGDFFDAENGRPA
jgi:superfamily I DNA/RNA helicase